MSRANGEGSVYQRKDGRWVASALDPQTGKRRSFYKGSREQAEKALAAMLTRRESGQVLLDAGATLATYGRAWLEDRAGRRRRESTVREYGWRLEKYVYPAIGGVRLRRLTALDVEDMLDGMASRGLSESTLRSVRNALAALLQDAVRARHLQGNVARSAQLPEDVKVPRQAVAPTAQQVARLGARHDVVGPRPRPGDLARHAHDDARSERFHCTGEAHQDRRRTRARPRARGSRGAPRSACSRRSRAAEGRAALGGVRPRVPVHRGDAPRRAEPAA